MLKDTLHIFEKLLGMFLTEISINTRLILANDASPRMHEGCKLGLKFLFFLDRALTCSGPYLLKSL